MASGDSGGKLGGPGKHVEVDETLVGGKSVITAKASIA
jgi:hypothetical protein